jgi:hypothetical protein
VAAASYVIVVHALRTRALALWGGSLALTYRDGVLIAGDGLALDMVKLYQVELKHFEKIEGVTMSRPRGRGGASSTSRSPEGRTRSTASTPRARARRTPEGH